MRDAVVSPTRQRGVTQRVSPRVNRAGRNGPSYTRAVYNWIKSAPASSIARGIALWPRDDASPKRVLVTGGASCPDGIIQQVIARINSFFPAERLRRAEAVLRDLGEG